MSDDEPYGSELIAAQLKVMAECPYLRKSKSQGLPYSYASEAVLIHKVRKSMIKNGLSIVPRGVGQRELRKYPTTKNGEMTVWACEMKFALLHKGGEQLECAVWVEAGDTTDKAAAKAQTMGLKYALRQLFMIETGDDPDRERQEQAGSEQLSLEEVKSEIEDAKTVEALRMQYKFTQKGGKWSRFNPEDVQKLQERIKERSQGLTSKDAAE